MKKKIVLVGGGGHCISCLDVIHSMDCFTVAGIVDRKENAGKELAGYPVIGNDGDLSGLATKYKNYFITIGQTRSAEPRIRIYQTLKVLSAELPVLISPASTVSESATIGEGSIVHHGAVVNSGAVIGKNCIINSMSLVEHETVIGDHTHISTGALVNGQCRVGSGVFVGSGAVIANNITIADGVIIGAGTVVIRDIAEKGTYAGNPARRID